MLVLGLVDIPWWGLILIAVLGYAMYSCRHFNYFKKQGIPGPRPYPILGTMLSILKNPPNRHLEYIKLYGRDKCFGSFLGAVPTLTVYDEDMLSEIMVKEFSAFTNRMTFRSGSPINDNMLINLDDAHWKHVRSEMTPTFSTGKLKKMNVEINRCARTLTESLEEQARGDGIVEMKEYTGGYTMDVIASTAFGIRVNSQKDRDNAFVDHARRAFVVNRVHPALLLFLLFPGLLKFFIRCGLKINIFAKDIRDFFENVARQTLDMRKADKDQSRSDFLQLMIRAQRGENISEDGDEGQEQENKLTGISTDEIIANAMLLFIAGYDTTSTSLSFFMYNMAKNPQIQEKLVEEINRVVGDKDVIDTTIVQEMPYLDMCVNENLRLYPPAIWSNRMTNRDVTIKGVLIKKGVIINIPIFGIHRDPQKWPEPDKFDPERFSADKKKLRNPYHFLPFGNGPRNCIGLRLALQELKVAIVHVLRKVKVSKCDQTQDPITFSSQGAILKAKCGITLRVESRREKKSSG